MDIPKPQSHTPLMQQYWDIKAQHMDKILLFRMGDFYEMFFDDAIKAAPLLNIALTSRSKVQGQEVAMCGVPFHSIGPQINKLLGHGLKVAICDQVESAQAAKEAKKIVKRAVTRVVTPGMVYDPETLDQTLSNFVVAVIKYGESTFSLAALDASTGEMLNDDNLSRGELASWIEKLSPQEFVVPEQNTIPFPTTKLLTVRKLKDLQEVTQFLVDYARETQGEEIIKVLRPPETLVKDFLKLSPQTLRHLEIFKRTDGETELSLFWALDLTKTPMGARLLRKRLGTPFRDLTAIKVQFDRVEFFLKDSQLRAKAREKLAAVGDLERKVARLSNPLCNSRDLKSLGLALEASTLLWNELEALSKCFPANLDKAKLTCRGIQKTLQDELPHSTREGGLVRPGVNSILDEYVDLDTHAQARLTELEFKERTNSGIASLKIKYNSVFGYSFEVTKTNLEKVPAHFVRRQTMAQGERYITAELSDLEQKILSAQQKRHELEFQIFNDLKHKIIVDAQNFLSLSTYIAEIDLALSFAELAAQQKYVRPEFVDEEIELVESRHPVLEKSLKEPFIPNDITLRKSNCLLLTGPNMAGKSTLMRQVALISLMAHCGSFVPAASAKLPLLRQIFTRIGAQDNVAQGLSTFMVEMTETAEIIRSATSDSLVILDEIGRGTSTYDGMSLAQAVLEHFISNVKSYTFFATHYHELTDLAGEYPEIVNGHMSIKEHKGQLIFLRKLAAGAANRSYGIDVAKQAGLPESVTKQAQIILDGLVQKPHEIQSRQLSLEPLEEATKEPQLQFPEKLLSVTEEIKKMVINSITPIEALNHLSRIQAQLSEL
jgi:DNA mismatch repair protein MutS